MKKSTKKTMKQSDIISTNFYKYIIENSQDAILLTRPDGTIDYANPEACKMFGRTLKDICKIGRNGLIDLTDQRLPKALEIRKKTGKFKGELNFIKKNGKVFPAEISTIIFKDDSGLERTSMIIKDITEAKETEKKTRLLAHTTMSIEEIITITDIEDRFTFVNQAFCNIYGYTYEEIIGQNVKRLVSPNNPPELLKEILEHSHKGHWKGEILNLTKDGREFPIYLQTSRIIDEEGKLIGLAGISEDISDRKKVESELRKSEEKYHAIFEATGTATLLVEEDTTISMANNESMKITGFAKEELIGTKWTNYVEPSSLQEMLKNHKLRRENPDLAPKSYEVKLFNKKKEIKDAILDIGMIPGTKQSIVSILDITERKRAEKTLRESRDILDSTQKLAKIGGWEWDVNEKTMKWSDETYRIHGFTPGEIEESSPEHIKRSLKCYNPNDRPIIEEAFKLCIEEGKPYILEFPLTKKTGEQICIQTMAKPVYNEDKKIIKVVGNIIDITERRKIEEALKEEKRQQLTLISNLPGFAYRCKNDKDWTMTFISDACQIITGYSAEEFVNNKKLSFNDIILPKYQKNLWNKWQEILKKKTKFEDEYEIKTASGEIRWVWERGNGIFDDKGELLYLEGYIEDITKRKQAETQLNLQSLVLNQIQDRVTVTDLKGKITYINDSEVKTLGYSREELIGSTVEKYGDDPEKGATQPEILEETLKHGEWRGEVVNKSADGREIILDCRTQIVFDENGNRIALAGIATDITERKQAEKALKESEEKFRKVFYTSPDSVNINRLEDGMYVSINEGFTQTTGFTEDDVNNKTSMDINIWANPDDRIRLVDELKAKGTAKNLEFLFRKKNGEIGSGLMSATIFDLNGISHIISITRDITERKKIEEEIKRSELQFRTLFMSLSEGFYISEVIYDDKGNPCDYKYLEVNPEFEKIIGLKRDQIIGKRYKEIVPLDTTNWLDNYFAVATRGEPRTFEFYSEEYNIHFETYSYRPFKNQVCVFVRDISERKKSEELLRDSERKFRETVENLQEGYYKCTIEGILFECNPAFKEIMGFITEKELVGLNLLDFWQNPNDREEYLKSMTEFGHIKNYPVNAKKITGEKMYLLVNSHLLKNNKGEYTGIEGTIVDLTEQKRATDALSESEYKYKNLIETMPEGFYRSTPEGYFVDVNPAFVKMLGFESKEELMRVNIPEELYFTKEERTVGEEYNVDFINDTEIYRLKKKDGSEIWVEDHSRYIQDSSGKILFHEGIMRDITDSLRAQNAIIEAKEKAEEANRLKSSFLANMSHEIRTPLNGILGFSEILKNELKEPSLIKYADIIEKSGNRLLETLNLILSFSKLEAEKEDVHYSNVRIEDVIEEVLKSFEAMAKNKNLLLNLSVKEKELITYLDERFLRQIMNNLLNNAIKYTETGGITVSLSKDNSNVIIKVKDTGIGISKEKHKIIFEEFRQESEGHGRSFEGTGLGLAITKRFVELMKGTIEVESEIGVGSTFIVKFPFIKASQTITIKIKKDDSKKEAVIPKSPEKDKLKILIVENDTMNLDYTVEILKEYYNIESAVDGFEALDKIKSKKFDIILMDINLGKGMDGIETVKKIKNYSEYSNTPIIALTAFVLPGDREEFLAGGCTHYLGKPFTRDQILELLNKIKLQTNFT